MEIEIKIGGKVVNCAIVERELECEAGCEFLILKLALLGSPHRENTDLTKGDAQ